MTSLRWTPRATAAALVAASVALTLPASASAFGTIDGQMGQHAEHEKITRVLACDSTSAPLNCFGPLSIDELAGTKGTLGGVGIPDNPLEILDHPEAHCDDGDYLPGAPYDLVQSGRAAGAIRACVAHFDRRLASAVEAAGGLLDRDGNVVAAEADTSQRCGFALGAAGEVTVGYDIPRAKCRVFNGLGRALHTAEDFWSHSNWADEADPDVPVLLAPALDAPPVAAPPGVTDETGEPAQGARAAAADADDPLAAGAEPAGRPAPVFNVANPAGQGRTDVVPFLRYPVAWDQVPTAEQSAAGLAPISGCDDSAQNVLDWVNKVRGAFGQKRFDLCAGRVGHSHLNKDKGLIDPRTGVTGSPDTPRARVADNFQRAVTGARNQALAVWDDFQRALAARYGHERAATMIHALTHDTPWTQCVLSGNAFAASPPTGGPGVATSSVTATIVNRTGHALGCSTATLSSGQWASLPPDQVAPGSTGEFRVDSKVTRAGGGGPQGTAAFDVGQTGYRVQVDWNNPLMGTNRMACQVTRHGVPVSDAPLRCQADKPSGRHARPTFTVIPA